MQPAEADPLVKVTWHVPRSTLARLKEQSRLSGAPVAEVVRRTLDAVTPGLGPKVSSEVILPKVVEPGPWREGVLESRGGKTDVRPAVRVPTEDGANLVDQGTGEVLAVEKGRPARAKVQHHDDAVVGGGALVKCRRCTLVKNAARPEVCDG